MLGAVSSVVYAQTVLPQSVLQCGACTTKDDCSSGLECRGGLCQRENAADFCNPLRSDNLVDIVDRVITIAFWVALSISPIPIIYAGFLFVTAGGQSKNIDTAKSMLLWTVIGLVVIMMARGIVPVLRNLFGI